MKKQFLKDHELDLNFKATVQKERELLTEILEFIKEVHRRRLYLKFGYSSLYSYLTQHIGYSEGAAMRRIDAMKLSLEIPEVSQKLELGELSLAQVSEIQKASREFVKMHKEELKANPTILTETKLKALNEIHNSNNSDQRTTQKIVSKAFNIPVIESTIHKTQKDESVRIELTLNRQQFEKLQKMKSLLSHVVPDGDLRAVLEYLSDKVIAQKSGTAKPEKEIKLTTPVKKVYRSILAEKKVCQYQDPKTHKTCTATWRLQTEHIHPRWAGGTDASDNLTVLCAAHNQLKYREQIGIS